MHRRASPTVICLLREADEPDAYEEAFRAAGFTAYSVPVLQYPFTELQGLREALGRPGAYGGLILTSPRAVAALVETLPWLPDQVAAWQAKPVFVVGPRTARDLTAVGFQPEGQDCGSAALLAERIATARYDGPLLFLCGNRRRDELPDRLAEKGVPVEERCVYETHPATRIVFSGRPSPNWLVFFSPSGLEAARNTPGLRRQGLHVAAIGPTTAGALDAAGWPADAVAEAPTPEALVAAVLTAAHA